MAKKKTWREKLSDTKDLPKVVLPKENAQKHWKGNSMAVPSPMEVNQIMAKVPKGKLITIDEIRKRIARKHKADIGCPLTCGIFTWLSAHAAAEELAAGKKRITLYWRTLKTGGELNPKYPGGIDEQKKHLESEGHRVIQKGRKYIVEEYEKHLLEV
ncbi:MAG: MGMT family protein [Deltaproteobacteria bacterium]|nr:MGMT family protein [Deltaproteobacteria bacterium]